MWSYARAWTHINGRAGVSARFVSPSRSRSSLLSLLVVSTAIGGRTSLSSFPMGTIPHGIYNNNGHERGRRVDLYLPVRFSFSSTFHRRSFLSYCPPSSLLSPLVFLRSFLRSVSPLSSYFLLLFTPPAFTHPSTLTRTRDSPPREITIPRFLDSRGSS